ncbi:MAG: LysR family transcriptional regulator [Niabella sp.]
MFDFRLRVFYIVAKRLNFTKAAEELFITQPAVSKHIHEIEELYKIKLFERNGTRIKLTQAGNILLKYAEEIFDIYRNIEFEFAALTKDIKGKLKMGASTTVAQYFIPKHLASFKQKFPDLKITLLVHNTEEIENLLLESKINLGIVEGQTKRKDIKYTPLVKDEMVLCTGTANHSLKKTAITLKYLPHLPLVMRESGSGSREVVMAALKRAGINFSDLNIDIEFESTESIKSYLLNSNSYAFLSITSIFKELKNGELKIIDVKDLEIERYFYFITQQGDARLLNEVFLKHLSINNFKL